MPRPSRLALTGFVLVASAGLAWAQQPGGPPPAPRPDAIPEMMRPMPDMMGGTSGMPMMMMHPMSHITGTLAFIKAELGITAAQAPQWDAFADALRAAAQGIQQQVGPMPMVGAPGLSWPERLTRTETILSARLTAVRALKGPVAALYGVLTDDQKHKADELMAFPVRMM